MHRTSADGAAGRSSRALQEGLSPPRLAFLHLVTPRNSALANADCSRDANDRARIVRTAAPLDRVGARARCEDRQDSPRRRLTARKVRQQGVVSPHAPRCGTPLDDLRTPSVGGMDVPRGSTAAAVSALLEVQSDSRTSGGRLESSRGSALEIGRARVDWFNIVVVEPRMGVVPDRPSRGSRGAALTAPPRRVSGSEGSS